MNQSKWPYDLELLFEFSKTGKPFIELFKNHNMQEMESKTVVKKIAQTQKKVKECLEKYPESRDNDEKLVARFWLEELIEKKFAPKVMNTIEFLSLYATNILTSADVITRARRKCQEKYPETRGAKWDERHREEEAVRKEIKSI